VGSTSACTRQQDSGIGAGCVGGARRRVGERQAQSMPGQPDGWWQSGRAVVMRADRGKQRQTGTAKRTEGAGRETNECKPPRVRRLQLLFITPAETGTRDEWRKRRDRDRRKPRGGKRTKGEQGGVPPNGPSIHAAHPSPGAAGSLGHGLWAVGRRACWDLLESRFPDRCGNIDGRGTNASGMHWAQGAQHPPAASASAAALGCEIFSRLRQHTHPPAGQAKDSPQARAGMDTSTPLRPQLGFAAGVRLFLSARNSHQTPPSPRDAACLFWTPTERYCAFVPVPAFGTVD